MTGRASTCRILTTVTRWAHTLKISPATPAAGNVQQIQHLGSNPANPGWTRAYAYNEASQTEPARSGNRLTSTTIGGTTETYSAAGNGYDPHGNMLQMPQLQVMQWDFKNQMQMTGRQAVNASDSDGARHQGEKTYYAYDASGQRVIKATFSSPGRAGQTAHLLRRV